MDRSSINDIRKYKIDKRRHLNRNNYYIKFPNQIIYEDVKIN